MFEVGAETFKYRGHFTHLKSLFIPRRKLQNKLKESDEALSELQAKYSSLEKAKHHMAAELEDLNLDLEKVRLLSEASIIQLELQFAF